MAEIDEKKTIDVCEADIEKVNDDKVEAVMGGTEDAYYAGVFRRRYDNTPYANMKPQYAE